MGRDTAPLVSDSSDSAALGSAASDRADRPAAPPRAWPSPATLLQRPLLVGGLGLSATLALLGSTHLHLFDSSTLLSAIALGSGLWWWRRGDRAPQAPKPIAPPVVDRPRVETELAALAALIDTLAQESALSNAGAGAEAIAGKITSYRQAHQALHQELGRQGLRVAIAGDPRTGKSTLLAHLVPLFSGSALPASEAPASEAPASEAPASEPPASEAAVTQPAPALALEEVSLAPGAAPDWLGYDGVVLVTDGDIANSALDLLRQRVIAGQGTVLVFNKQDHYAPAEQQTILARLHDQAATLPAPVAVVATAAAPRPIKVRRHQSDGTATETMETPPPAIAELRTAIETALVVERPALVAATVLRQTQAQHQQVQAALNGVRRDRALPAIEQLQWVAGAAAFANPVPTLDLLATVAISGQLIVDLGKIYGFNLTLEEAKTAAGTLASLTVKLGLVELSTQVLTTVLKSHFATYVAGGLVQGLSAAYLTRMAGLSLVEYFEQAALEGTPTTELSWGAIAQRLQTTVQQNRQLSLLQALARQGIDILKPAQAQPSAQLRASEAVVELVAEPVVVEPVVVEPVVVEKE